MDKYKEKIRKLLALSASSNEHEAKAALLKARELMAEHKIRETDLKDTGTEVHCISVGTYTRRGEWWREPLASIIAAHYCCRASTSRRKGGQKRELKFTGLAGDAELCARVFSYAAESAKSCAEQCLEGFRHLGPFPAKIRKNLIDSYAAGFTEGVRRAFEDQDREKGGKWALALSVPSVVDAACAGFKNDCPHAAHDVVPEMARAGYREGTMFSVADKIDNM